MIHLSLVAVVWLAAAVNGWSDTFYHFAAPSYTVNETNGTASIAIVRTGDTNEYTEAYLYTSDGTATVFQDYTNAEGFVGFAPGQSIALFTIPILNDALGEGSETVVVTMIDDPHGIFTNATLTIVDDDRPPQTHYVNLSSTNPAPPFTNWATAATAIQDAIDVALAGDEIVVTNGVYETGGRAVYGAMTNRAAVNQPLTVRSVNGPEVTVIRGHQLPGTTNGDGAVRCVYLTNGAVLVGFTLTNGATRLLGVYPTEITGGGVWCESASAVVSNCVLNGNQAHADGGGAFRGELNNCTLSRNSAGRGGGASDSTLNNCTLTSNSASEYGGGTLSSTLNHCALLGNSSAGSGGGAFGGTLNKCILTGNSAVQEGGGGAYATLNNCTFDGNSAFSGGGASASLLNNCTLTANSANSGGGAIGGTLNNCTLAGNSAFRGGGAYSCALTNCIAYFNTAVEPGGANYFQSSLNYCCTTPLPTDGVGNLTAEPQLASASHLSAGSPCRGAGSPAYTSGVDIDGQPWSNPPSIGCDEVYPGAETGPLTVTIQAAFTNVATGFEINFAAQINGNLSASRWEFGDGTVVSNRPYLAHSWPTAGDYPVVLRAYNATHPGGMTATVIVHAVENTVQYVAVTSGSPLPPYTSWATAATNIQDAVDAGFAGGTILVSNGVYATGGRAVFGTMTNRVAVDKPLAVRSVNGPEATVIRGEGTVRCVYLMNGAALAGFTLTNGATGGDGGGVWCESVSVVVSNCVLSGNSADSGGGAFGGTLNNCTLIGNFSAGYCFGVGCRGDYGGGGAIHSTLNNCTLRNNHAYYGGGADGSTLNNCTLTSNSAWYGGGASGGTLNNCTLTGNSALGGGGGAWYAALNNCTLTQNSASYGGGASYGMLNNCTLTANSARNNGGGASYGTLNNCIVYFNAATNGANYFEGPGLPLILNYTCTTPLPTDGAGNFTNAPLFVDQAAGNLRLQPNSPCINSGRNAYAPPGPDLDGHSRIVGGTVDVGAYEFQSPQSVISYAWLQQYGLPTDGSADSTDADGDGLNNWQEWRCLTDPTNALSVLRLLSPAPTSTNVTLRWQSVAGVNYFLERSTNLTLFTPVATNLPGQPSVTAYTDTNTADALRFFYRVGVE